MACVECGCGPVSEKVSETGPRVGDGSDFVVEGKLEEVTGCTDDVDVTDDANEYAGDGVGDGDCANFLVDHDVDDFVDFGFGVHCNDVALHEGADGSFETSVGGVDGVKFVGHGHGESAEVAVADHADEFAFVDDG